jgi:glycosyltransferase involved in cell wall biosynthesis
MTTDKDNKAIFFGFSFLHHGPHTAFHGLAKALADQIVVDVTPPLPRQTPYWIMWRFSWRWLAWSERRLKPYFAEHTPRVIHYFFPENTMRKLTAWKRHHRVIATCHQSVSNLAPRDNNPMQQAFMDGLKTCDILVVQCPSQVPEYEALFPGVRVECIPLGVDTDFFRPAADPARSPGPRPRILTVGNWLRDYGTWARVVEAFAGRPDAPEFTVIATANTLAKAKAGLRGQHAPVRYLTGISDEALRDEYDRADVFFLPLNDAMANDAVLEALAMGSATVITDLAATRDYMGDAAVYVKRHDPAQVVAAIGGLLASPDRVRNIRMLARQRACGLYAWQKVADQYRSLYRAMSGAV